MGFLIKLAVACAAIVGIGFWVAEGVERQNVRDCLEEMSQEYGIAKNHHIFMSDVVEVEIYRSFGDGSATRFVKYRLQGSSEIQSTTCRW